MKFPCVSKGALAFLSLFKTNMILSDTILLIVTVIYPKIWLKFVLKYTMQVKISGILINKLALSLLLVNTTSGCSWMGKRSYGWDDDAASQYLPGLSPVAPAVIYYSYYSSRTVEGQMKSTSRMHMIFTVSQRPTVQIWMVGMKQIVWQLPILLIYYCLQ